jgi:sugar phosphate isomerase/epimerase
LKQFLAAVDRPNLGVNFDPANMVMYGSGDPIEALAAVAESVVTVHCKDGVGPPAAGQLGHETPLGAGEVGMERFVRKLQQIGYQGPLIIEREIVGEAQREDIRQAIDLLNRLRQS